MKQNCAVISQGASALMLKADAVKLAAAFEIQRAAAVPIDSFDVAMDAVATELRIY